MINEKLILNEQNFQTACCNFYEHKMVQMLLGSSFHPGGLDLTKKLGENLGFSAKDKILDVASGLGSSALCLAENFGSTVIGIDISRSNVEEANKKATLKKLGNLVSFIVGSVELLPFENNSFDYVLSECSFCLFENKNKAGKEIHRVLKPQGKIIMTDIAIEKQLPLSVDHIVYRVACIASALSMSAYVDYFEQSGFTIQSATKHDEILLQLVEDVKKKVFVLELAKGIGKIDTKAINIKDIKFWIQQAKELLHDGYATYIILIGSK